MSALLLDTHVWLWYAEGDAARLSAASVRKIDDARKADGLLVSAISVWELGILHAKRRVQLSLPLRDWVKRALEPPGISLIALDADAAAESTLLPGDPCGDPADRFLMATARINDAILATRDKGIVEYGDAGYVRVLEL